MTEDEGPKIGVPLAAKDTEPNPFGAPEQVGVNARTPMYIALGLIVGVITLISVAIWLNR